ncbi:FecCD family ABC transporter permease [Lacticaseibacillus baoqingensis]|uniref:FecCD family ABC transporter permease n=1 Tax=Lacticaseibacillus baoqingensis TaxID=2486013 RepID=A0ABW4E1G6_9LACO|nr:iron ABC transporter permease [Lacticaseibacillus baoqingensis]
MNKKTLIGWVASTIVMLALTILLLSLGDISLSFGQVLQALFGGGDRIASIVVWKMRLPYVAAALITGACLAASGLLLQTLTHNALVDSSILGVNAGASLGAVLLITLGASIRGFATDTWLPLAAVLGACLSLALVAGQKGTGSRLQLLLRGVALTALLNGVILMLQLNMNSFAFDRVLVWLSGSFWNVDWVFLRHYGLAAIALIVIVFALIRPLGMLVLGDDMAAASGVNVTKLKRGTLLLAIALAAVAVTVGGAISLVGLMAPNIAKHWCGHRFAALLPVTIMVGEAIMLLATIVANNLFLPALLPVGLVVAVITMPYFLFLLFQQ